MELTATLEALIRGQELDSGAAEEVMRRLMSGELDDARIAALLVALRMKGVTGRELASFVSVMREHAMPVRAGEAGAIDMCGTGGGPPTLNLSTGAAFVAAACGAKVAKHGNRAVASRCGSADVLEAWGARLTGDAEQLAHILERVGIVFLFAPNHHPSVRHVGPVRKALGVRTVFNVLGPLANPAGVRRQLVGVYERELMRPVAEALQLLGCEHGAVVHGQDGLDEVSPCARTWVLWVRPEGISEGTVGADDFHMRSLDMEHIAAAHDAAEAAVRLRHAVSGHDAALAEALVPNAAMALVIAGRAEDLGAAADLAREGMRSGKALAKLDEFVGATASA